MLLHTPVSLISIHPFLPLIQFWVTWNSCPSCHRVRVGRTPDRLPIYYSHFNQALIIRQEDAGVIGENPDWIQSQDLL